MITPFNNDFLILNNFLNQLNDSSIWYRLDKFSSGAITVTVSIPGYIWEIEFLDDGKVHIETFSSNGVVAEPNKVSELLQRLIDENSD